MTKSTQQPTFLRARTDASGDLGVIVRAKRKELGLRQEELADLADCSPRFVHDLENGKATVQLDKVLAVLHALGLHLLVTDQDPGA